MYRVQVYNLVKHITDCCNGIWVRDWIIVKLCDILALIALSSIQQRLHVKMYTKKKPIACKCVNWTGNIGIDPYGCNIVGSVEASFLVIGQYRQSPVYVVLTFLLVASIVCKGMVSVPACPILCGGLNFRIDSVYTMWQNISHVHTSDTSYTFGSQCDVEERCSMKINAYSRGNVLFL